MPQIKKKINLTRAAMWGAAMGLATPFARAVANGGLPGPTARLVGNLVGSVIAGVFMFTLVAALINRGRR